MCDAQARCRHTPIAHTCMSGPTAHSVTRPWLSEMLCAAQPSSQDFGPWFNRRQGADHIWVSMGMQCRAVQQAVQQWQQGCAAVAAYCSSGCSWGWQLGISLRSTASGANITTNSITVGATAWQHYTYRVLWGRMGSIVSLSMPGSLHHPPLQYIADVGVGGRYVAICSCRTSCCHPTLAFHVALQYIADDYGGCAYSAALPEKSIVMHHWG
jgi:hypothetical protein